MGGKRAGWGREGNRNSHLTVSEFPVQIRGRGYLGNSLVRWRDEAGRELIHLLSAVVGWSRREGESALAGGVNAFGAFTVSVFSIVCLAGPPHPNMAAATDSTQVRSGEPHWTGNRLRMTAKRVTKKAAAATGVVVVVVVVRKKRSTYAERKRGGASLCCTHSGRHLQPSSVSVAISATWGVPGWAINFPHHSLFVAGIV